MRIFKKFDCDDIKVQITMMEALSIIAEHDEDRSKLEKQFLDAKYFKSYKCRLYIEEGIIYPDIEVDLSEVDGNAFSILSHVTKAMRKAGLRASQITEYQEKAMKGNYDQLLSTTAEFVNLI